MPDPHPVRLVTEPVPGLATADPLDVVRGCAPLAGPRRLSVLAGRWGAGGTILTADPVEVRDLAVGSGQDPFAHLDRLPALTATSELPNGAVGGGWLTVLGHDLGRRTGRVRNPPAPDPTVRLPTAAASFHDHVLRHDGERWWAEALDSGDGLAVRRARDLAEFAESVAASVAASARGALAVGTASAGASAADEIALTEVPDADAHMLAVEECLDAIRAGEIAQANVCSRFGLRLTDGGPAAVRAWVRLVAALRPDRGALVTGPWGALVGASPELYLAVRAGRVASAPIKGTRPAGQEATLRASAKDAGENVMIVDLVRNDLSRVSQPGTVEVTDLLSVQPHAGVLHLVSRVTGTLAAGTSTADVLRATFPPASVTGTPKQRATEVTNALEARPRGWHTGAVGFVGPTLAELAVVIRSLEVAADGTAELGVGGGVVADSTPVEEWTEVVTKAAPLLGALGLPPPGAAAHTAAGKGLADARLGLIDTLLVTDGRAVERAGHVARLRRSFWELGGRDLRDAPDVALTGELARLGGGWHRLRLTARGDGSVAAASEPWRPPVAAPDQPGLRLDVVEGPPDGLERHKYADRAWLLALEASRPAGFDGTVVAGRGDTGLLSGTRACLFAVVPTKKGPGLLTPPLDGRILPGVTRQVLIDLAVARNIPVRRGRLDAAALDHATAMCTVNSLRGVEWVRELGPFHWPGPGPLLTRLSEALLHRWSAG